METPTDTGKELEAHQDEKKDNTEGKEKEINKIAEVDPNNQADAEPEIVADETDVVTAVETSEKPAKEEDKVGDESLDLNACLPCNLIFGTKENLESHKKSDNHKMLEKGFNPSFGKYYCFLCWRGFAYKVDLQDHYASLAHAEAVQKQNVVAVHTAIEFHLDEEADERKRRKRDEDIKARDDDNNKKTSSKESVEEKKRERSRSSRERNERNNDYYLSRTARVALGKGLNHCVECNLVFISEKSEMLHRESQRHRAVFENKRPMAPSGTQTPFCCFLCWWSYIDETQLHEHFVSEEHEQRMKRYGVARLLVDARFVVNGDRSPVPDSFEDYVILDEIGPDDDENLTKETHAVDDVKKKIDTDKKINPNKKEVSEAEDVSNGKIEKPEEVAKGEEKVEKKEEKVEKKEEKVEGNVKEQETINNTKEVEQKNTEEVEQKNTEEVDNEKVEVPIEQENTNSNENEKDKVPIEEKMDVMESKDEDQTEK